MIQHITLITFKADTDSVQQQAVLAAFKRLPGLIPDMQNFHAGLDLGLLEGNAGLAVTAQFSRQENFLAYATHSAHMDVIFPVCGEVMASYATSQFEI
ncbi:Dabb family protein [Halieaceae bacterium IMCC14734]|uniref:Dabb family protein n=1 Tax=Candidatus Litorirhabdus singularis TaxID=2518993 RepID=A0ABT3TJV7_9GAMM|nr:Dabb family protein [Candidatus Litorirhabdus singularis]MCX2981704.1 Dabb family protein [Candidatus Litorirhabdus singularis]